MYDWQSSEGHRTLTLDGRHFLAHTNRLGWTLYELDAPNGSMTQFADDVPADEIDRALQQYIGGN